MITIAETLFGPPRIASRTPAAWVDEPYTRFSLRPVNPTIGAFVGGVRLSEPIGDELHHQLNRALLEWKVLFFREQHLTHEQHRTLGERWGELETHPFFGVVRNNQDAARPKVTRLAGGAAGEAKGAAGVWHSDTSWRACPSLGSLLQAVEVPPVGGDTLWADMAAAYDCLGEDVKAQIDGRYAVHDWWDSFGQGMQESQREALRSDFPPVEHPIVRTHPETGRKTLYVNAVFTQRIVGMDPDDSAVLLRHLFRQASYPEFQCRLRWEPGTLAFWDNRATQHCPSADYLPHRRVMERITIGGDRPF